MYSIGEFSQMIGVTTTTLIRWDKSGKLVPDKLPSGHRRYTDVHFQQIKGMKSNRINVIYSRESTRQQTTSLDRQEEKLKEFCQAAGYQVDKCIRDFGSGLNYNRKGLKELLLLISSNAVDKVIIYYSDRIMRFGFDMFQEICRLHKTEIVVVDKTETNKTQQEEFAEDLIAIVHYFSMRLYGSRSYKTKLKEDQYAQDHS